VVMTSTEASAMPSSESAEAKTKRHRSDSPSAAAARRAMIEQVLGDVGEDHVTGRAEPFQRAECDQAVPGAHVERGVTGLQLGLVEHRVPDRVQQLGEETLTGGGIAAESRVHQPRVPAVRSLGHTSHCARVPPAAGSTARRSCPRMSQCVLMYRSQ